MTEHVKVMVRFREGEDLPAAEGLWAEPVTADAGGGTFRLRNNAVLVSMAAGDLVEAQVNGDGVLQVVDVVEPCRGILTVVVRDPGGADDELGELTDRWRAAGAFWTEGGAGMLVTVWSPGVDLDAIASVLEHSPGCEWVSTALPDERRREAQALVNFALDTERHVAEPTADYGVQEDPYWAKHGLDYPDFLGFVQHLAGQDRRVARALERGQHERVLTFIRRITAPAEVSFPPVDEPGTYGG